MAVALPNLWTDWGRDALNAATGVTTLAVPYLSHVKTHGAIIPSTAFHELPASARSSNYVLQVDPGTDIVTGDYMLNAYGILDGLAWPGDYPFDPAQPGFGNTYWVVQYHQESTKGYASYRALYMARVTVGGTTSPNG